MDTKEILKRLLKVAQTQQKVLEKLAQVKGDPMDPFAGSESDDPAAVAERVKKNFPWLAQEQGQQTQQSQQTSQAPQTPSVPVEVATALDLRAKELKGSLQLTFDGTNVYAKYNGSSVRKGANEVKALLQSALSPKYTVVNVIGESGASTDFKANY